MVYKCKVADYSKAAVYTWKVLHFMFTVPILITVLDTVEVTPFFKFFFVKHPLPVYNVNYPLILYNVNHLWPVYNVNHPLPVYNVNHPLPVYNINHPLTLYNVNHPLAVYNVNHLLPVYNVNPLLTVYNVNCPLPVDLHVFWMYLNISIQFESYRQISHIFCE